MRSSLILASILSLAIASPINGNAARQDSTDPCACDYMCIMQAGPAACACEIEAKNNCYVSQVAAGLNCSAPAVSESCGPVPTPIEAGSPVPTSTSSPELTSEPTFGAEGDRCGSRGFLTCGPDLICSTPKPNCADCGGICEAVPVVGEKGERCGSRGLKECGPDLVCKGQRLGCADCPGTCQPVHTFGEVGERCGSKGLKTCGPELECEKKTSGCMDCPGTCKVKSVSGKEGDRCGSKGLKNCGEGLVCAGQREGCMDCPGTCQKPKVCGGFMGSECEKGECVLDEKCVKGGGSDCQGSCAVV